MENITFKCGKSSNLENINEYQFDSIEEFVDFLRMQKEINSNIKGFDFDPNHNTIVAIDSNVAFAEYNITLNE